MKIHELKVATTRSTKRVGRGISAGQGKTAGRGTKGQKSRTGKGRRPGFEGGQTRLMRRLPKLRGFRSIRTPMETVYTGQLSSMGTNVDNYTLAEAGLVTSPYVQVKLLFREEVPKKYTIKLQAASANAVAAIQKSGGIFSKTAQVKRISTKSDDKKAKTDR
jgi:large subunit ribosomal protein L15